MTAYRPVAFAALALVLLPFIGRSEAWTELLVATLILALFAQGWNLLGGFGGQFSLGHAAFFGAGAYASALLQVLAGLNAWAAFLAGISAGAVLGALIGLLVFRSGFRVSHVALVTLVVAEALRLVVTSPSVLPARAVPLPSSPGVASFQLGSGPSFYIVAAGLVVGVLALTRWFERSRLGIGLVAAREDEEVARALGVRVLRVRLVACVLSASVSAAAGGLYLQHVLSIDAWTAFGAVTSIQAVLACALGGMGTLLGPLAGAALLRAVAEGLGAVGLASYALLAYGALLVGCLWLLPRGLLGLAERAAAGWPRRVRRRPVRRAGHA